MLLVDCEDEFKVLMILDLICRFGSWGDSFIIKDIDGYELICVWNL